MLCAHIPLHPYATHLFFPIYIALHEELDNPLWRANSKTTIGYNSASIDVRGSLPCLKDKVVFRVGIVCCVFSSVLCVEFCAVCWNCVLCVVCWNCVLETIYT